MDMDVPAMIASSPRLRYFLIILVFIFAFLALHSIPILPQQDDPFTSHLLDLSPIYPASRKSPQHPILIYQYLGHAASADGWETRGRGMSVYSEGTVRRYATVAGYGYEGDVGVYSEIKALEGVDETGEMDELFGLVKALTEELGKGKQGAKWIVAMPVDSIITNPRIPLHELLPQPPSSGSPLPLILASSVTNGTLVYKVDPKTLVLLYDVFAEQRNVHSGGFRAALSQVLGERGDGELDSVVEGQTWAPMPVEWFDSVSLPSSTHSDTPPSSEPYTPQLALRIGDSPSRARLRKVLASGEKVYADAEKLEIETLKFHGHAGEPMTSVEAAVVREAADAWWGKNLGAMSRPAAEEMDIEG
ncbi:hypothetical protein IAT38_006213 [Cryptococcus sp. DSM 104549]